MTDSTLPQVRGHVPTQHPPVPPDASLPRQLAQAHHTVPRAGRQFAFDGGAASYIGTGLLGFLITLITIGICYPFALVLRERWRAKHSYINGQQLSFTGSAWGLFGSWIKWFLLIVLTLGIFSLWVGPRIARWKWENTCFATSTLVSPA